MLCLLSLALLCFAVAVSAFVMWHSALHSSHKRFAGALLLDADLSNANMREAVMSKASS